jgi:CheY-like chemotaxis protein
VHTETNRKLNKPSLRGIRVLSIDQDGPSARLVAALAEHAGGEAIVAASAEQALALIPQFEPRLIVLELTLPRMSGTLLARQLKADPATSHITLISTSAISRPDAQRIAFEAGCVAHIAKPVDVQTLLSTLVRSVGEES